MRSSTSGAGRTPYDVSAEPLGYDICSEAPDESVRCIEVKPRARTGPIALTPNEWLMAQW
ncbi:protein NO VEIN domain-containing protein [Thermalbibacter longus]|uniref:protein NO VEIN domain-containing protein n=1 Tax=Thermalbibacter longus TaxID=2951981 RepID=UPI00325FA8E8